MTPLGELSDEELALRAHQWRRLALHGVLHARGPAHEHEAELRRRYRVTTAAGAAADDRARMPPRGALRAGIPLLWRLLRLLGKAPGHSVHRP